MSETLGTDNSSNSPNGVNQPWTVQRIVNWSTTYLTDKGTDTPRLDSELLLCEVLKCKRIQLYMNFDQPVTVAERGAYKGLLRRRVAGEPIAYILGEKEFMGLGFKVTRDVLIPRPDTEVLVETAQEFLKGRLSKAILDIGVGSGCISISLAKLSQATGVAWDISESALMIARENAARHNIDGFSFELADARAFEAWNVWQKCEKKFDLIVSNPPYISFDEKSDLSVSVRDYEPSTALFAEESGLSFYRVIAERAAMLLEENGQLILEIGWKQASAVTELLTMNGWVKIRVIKDLAGRDRVVCASLGQG